MCGISQYYVTFYMPCFLVRSCNHGFYLNNTAVRSVFYMTTTCSVRYYYGMLIVALEWIVMPVNTLKKWLFWLDILSKKMKWMFYLGHWDLFLITCQWSWCDCYFIFTVFIERYCISVSRFWIIRHHLTVAVFLDINCFLVILEIMVQRNFYSKPWASDFTLMFACVKP